MGVWSTVDAILTAAYGVGYAERAVEKVKETKDLLVSASKNAMTTYSTGQNSTGQGGIKQDSYKIEKALNAFDE